MVMDIASQTVFKTEFGTVEAWVDPVLGVVTGYGVRFNKDKRVKNSYADKNFAIKVLKTYGPRR